jgi:hypothetical protein
VQFTQSTNEVEGWITTLSPFSNLNMLNIASYPSHFLFQHFKFRYLRMNHCKLTSGHHYCGLKKKFLKSIMNLLSLDTQNASHLLRTKQFQVMFNSDSIDLVQNIQVLSYWSNFHCTSIYSINEKYLFYIWRPSKEMMHAYINRRHAWSLYL